MKSIADEVREHHGATGNPFLPKPTRTAFRALTPEQQQTIVTKLSHFVGIWEDSFSELEHDQNEAAAQLVTELAAAYGEDAVRGAFVNDPATVDYMDGTPTVTNSTETYHAALDFPAIAKMVADDMKDVRAAAEEAEEMTN